MVLNVGNNSKSSKPVLNTEVKCLHYCFYNSIKLHPVMEKCVQTVLFDIIRFGNTQIDKLHLF